MKFIQYFMTSEVITFNMCLMKFYILNLLELMCYVTAIKIINNVSSKHIIKTTYTVNILL